MKEIIPITKKEDLKEIEGAFEKAGIASWIVFCYQPPTKLLYFRSKDTTFVRAILKIFTEHKMFKEIFRGMIAAVDQGLMTEPIPTPPGSEA